MYISSLSIAHPRDLVRTYNQRGRDDAWEAVRNYVRAMELPRPLSGSNTRRSRLRRPRARVDRHRSEPSARGRDRDTRRSDDRRGTTDTKYEIEWTVTNDSTEERLFDATETLGIELEEVDAKDVTCYEPTESSTVGRVLAAYGCPVGSKDHGEIPAWIRTSPPHIHGPFVEQYLDLRAKRYEDDEWYRVYCSRPETFHEQLTSVIDTAAGSMGEHGFETVVLASARRRCKCSD